MLHLIQLAASGGMIYAGAKASKRVKLIKRFDPRHEELRQADPKQAPRFLEKLEDKYQEYIRTRIDPYLGGDKRATQLQTFANGEPLTPVTEYERFVNRNIAIGSVALAGSIVGGFVSPLLTLGSVGVAVWLTVPLYQNGYQAIVNEGRINNDVIGGLCMTGCWVTGYIVAGTVGAVCYYLGEKLVLRTEEKSRSKLTSVFGQQIRTVWVEIDGIEVEIPIEDVTAESIVIVKAGEMIPVDGTILNGIATIDQHRLTGESQPVEKSANDQVLAATVLLSGAIRVRVRHTGAETTAARICDILNRTTDYRMDLENKGIKIADDASPPTLAASIIAFPFTGPSGAIAVLGSCIGLNMKILAPITMLNYLNVAAHRGILIKDARSLDILKEVDTIVFDKTGTLTMEQPHVARIHVHGEFTEDEILALAAAAEHRQCHPIARAIRQAAEDKGLEVPPIEDAKYELGFGLKVEISGRTIRVGSRRFMESEQIEIPEHVDRFEAECHSRGDSMVMVGVNECLGGAIELNTTIRDEAREMVQALKERGYSLAIISGDQEAPTRTLANNLGIESYFANTLPQNKAAIIKVLQDGGKKVCFVGDGINDAVALKQANASVSLKGATTVATDTAQVILMDQSLDHFVQLLDIVDDVEENLKRSMYLSVGPGLGLIGGVFMLHFGIYASIVIYNISLVAGIGNAMLPLLKRETDEDPE